MKDPKDNILHLATSGEPDKFEIAIKELIDGMPRFHRLAPVIAEMRRVMYDNYIRKGFTPLEALELVKAEVLK